VSRTRACRPVASVRCYHFPEPADTLSISGLRPSVIAVRVQRRDAGIRLRAAESPPSSSRRPFSRRGRRQLCLECLWPTTPAVDMARRYYSFASLKIEMQRPVRHCRPETMRIRTIEPPARLPGADILRWLFFCTNFSSRFGAPDTWGYCLVSLAVAASPPIPSRALCKLIPLSPSSARSVDFAPFRQCRSPEGHTIYNMGLLIPSASVCRSKPI
jgi:hypothetical protein